MDDTTERPGHLVLADAIGYAIGNTLATIVLAVIPSRFLTTKETSDERA